MPELDELATLLRPAGGGLYVVSTGLAEQQALQRALYGVADTAEVRDRWRAALDKIEKARVLVLGVPSDVGAGFRRGANMGPGALRTALLQREPGALTRDGVVDLGDVFVVPQLLHDEMLSPAQRDRSAAALYPNVDEAARASLPVAPLSIASRALALVYERNPSARVMLLGGDHSVAWPAVEALHRPHTAVSRERWAIVQFDAHTDLMPERLGITYCFATWSYHANELFQRDGRLVQLGVRASRHDQKHWEGTLGVRQLWSSECNANEPRAIEAMVSHLRSLGVTGVYLSNDVDGTDPSAVDATGTPEPFGLRPEFVHAVIERLAREFVLVGGDVCELAPPIGETPASREKSVRVSGGYLRATLDAMLRA